MADQLCQRVVQYNMDTWNGKGKLEQFRLGRLTLGTPIIAGEAPVYRQIFGGYGHISHDILRSRLACSSALFYAEKTMRTSLHLAALTSALCPLSQVADGFGERLKLGIPRSSFSYKTCFQRSGGWSLTRVCA